MRKIAADGTLIFDTKIDTDGFKGGTNTIKSQANSIKSTLISLGKTMAVAFAVTKLVQFGKQAIETASDLQEVQNVVDTAFGDMAYKMEEFAATSIETFGMSKLAAKQAGSTYMAMASNMISSKKAASDMSTTLTGLTGDWSSFYNVSQGESQTALNSIFTGETEAMKRYGVVMTQVNLEEFARQRGINKSITAMTQEEQVLLRYNYVMAKSAMVQGDFAKTSGSWANQTRVLSERWKEFLGIMGNGLIQALTPAVKFLNSVMSYLITFANTMSQVMSSIFGVKQAVTSVSGAISDVTTSTGDASTGLTDMGDSAEDAAKKATKSAAGIDQLNVISSNVADSSSSAGGNSSGGTGSGGAGTVTTTSTNAPLDSVSSKFVEMFNNLSEAISPTLDALDRFKEALEPVGKLVFDNLKSLYSDVLKPIGLWIVGEGLPRLLDVASGLLEKIDWDKLSDALISLNKALAPFAISIANGLILFIESLGEILTPAISAAVDLFSTALGILADIIKKIPEDATIALGGAIGGLATAFISYNAATGVAKIVDGIKTSFGKLLTTLSKHPILIIAGALAALAGAALALDRAKFNNSALGKYVKKLDESIESANEFNDEVDDMIKNHDKQQENIESEYGAVEILSDKYFDLADKASLTNDEQLLMKTYSQKLIDKIPELSGLIDEQTGAYKGTKEEIENLITKTEEYYLVQAAQESLIEIAEAQYTAEKKLSDFQDEKGDLLDLITEKSDLYNESLKTGANRSGIMTQAEKDQALENIALGGEITILKDKAKKLDTTISDTKDSQKKLSSEWDYAVDYITTYSDSVDNTKDAINGVKTAVGNTKDAIVKADMSGYAKSQIDKFDAKYSSNTTTGSAVNKWLSGVSTIMGKYVLPDLKVGLSVDTSGLNAVVSGMSKYGINIKTPGYATGNVIPANNGNFLATLGDNKREPEVVSPLSTMKQAMKEAMKEMGGSGGDTTLKVYLEGKQIYEEVIKQNNQNTRRTGSNALTV